MHHVLSTPSLQDVLVEFPPVGPKNLVRLAEELLYTFQILPLDPDELTTLRTMQEYISNVISRDGTSPPSLSSAEAAAETETFDKVPFPRKTFSLSLKSPTVRRHRFYRSVYGLLHFACGSDSTPMPSSLNRESSPG